VPSGALIRSSERCGCAKCSVKTPLLVSTAGLHDSMRGRLAGAANTLPKIRGIEVRPTGATGVPFKTKPHKNQTDHRPHGPDSFNPK